MVVDENGKEWYGLIYKCTCGVNGKVYIGMTIKSLQQRVRGHRNVSRSGNKNHFARALDKHGFDNFTWDIISYSRDRDELMENEKYFIKYFKSNNPAIGYNIIEGGNGGYPASIETRRKLSLAGIGRKHSEATKQKMRVAGLGRRHTKEAIQKMRLAKLGKRASEVTKLKMSIAGTGRKMSDHTKKQLMIAHIGRPLSDDLKHRISIGLAGKKLSDGRKRKMSLVMIGNHCAPTKPVIQIDKLGNILGTHKSIASAAIACGIDPTGVGRVCHGKQKTCGGYAWRFDDQPTSQRPVVQISLNGGVVTTHVSIASAAKACGLCWGSVYDACIGRSHTAGGYRWRFKTEEDLSVTHE